LAVTSLLLVAACGGDGADDATSSTGTSAIESSARPTTTLVGTTDPGATTSAESTAVSSTTVVGTAAPASTAAPTTAAAAATTQPASPTTAAPVVTAPPTPPPLPAPARAEAAIGVEALADIGCSAIGDGGPPLVAGTEEFACIGRGGGPGFLVALGPNDVNAVVAAYLARPDYDPFGSSFIVRPAGNVVVFALNDFDFWANYPLEGDGSFFDRFTVVDTNCLGLPTDDPALCAE